MATQVAIENLSSWLQSQPANTKNTAYEIEITGLTTSNYNDISTALIDNAYKYVDLSYTEIPNGVTSMIDTFYNCTSLIEAPVIPNSVTTMGSTFNGCTSLTQAPTIPNSVINMQFTFYDCTSLTEAPIIPSSVTNMYSTFRGCTSLAEAPVIPSSVTNMNLTFYGCTSLVDAPVIPNSVAAMTATFQGCISLTEAPVIPNSVTSMISTFEGCTSLTEAPVIPNSVTVMISTFEGCTSLTEVPVISSSVTNMQNTFYGCTSLAQAPVIPNSVTNMSNAFSGCTLLVMAPTIPNSVTDMNHTFENCTSLIEAPVIPNSVTNMEYTFRNCTSLIEAPVIPRPVIYMYNTFEGCTSLKKITEFNIPLSRLKNNLDFKDVFVGCTSLTQIGFKPEEAESWHAFRLKFGSNTVSGKIYGRNNGETTVVPIENASISKTSLLLPNKTDELWFPDANTSDTDIDDIIEDVLESRYTYWNKVVINPSSKSFVMIADDPQNVVSNFLGSASYQGVFDVVHPVGEIYVQYPQQKEPAILYNRNGIISTWVEISYSGAFFRASGGNANSFIAEGSTLVKQASQNAYHCHSMKHQHTLNSGNTKTAGELTTAGIRHAISAASGGSWAFDTVARQNSRSTYAVSNLTESNGTSYQKLTSSSSGAASRLTHGGHTHSISGSSYIYGKTDEFTGNTGYNGNENVTEARPENYTIRIWKRTA